MPEMSDQERARLAELSEQIRTAHVDGNMNRAAHFAAKAHNLVEPEKPVAVPPLDQSPRRPAGW